jgi:hypothetical protein
MRISGDGFLAVVAMLLICADASAAGSLVLNYEYISPPERPAQVLLPTFMTPKKIDGILDDACWRIATQYDLGSDMPGGTVSRITTARLCYGADALYAAFLCREPAMGDLPLAETIVHDVLGPENVRICLTAGSGLDDFFILASDPDGDRYDWSKTQGLDWSPEWEVKTNRTADGWTAEIAIPYQSLHTAPPQPGTTWRLNFRRDTAATGEQCAWQPTLGILGNPSTWGRLFFGAAADLEKAPRPPAVRLYPERWTLRKDDRILRAVVKVDPGSELLQDLELQVGIGRKSDGGRAPAAPDAFKTKLQREGLELLLNADALPNGESVLYAELLSKDAVTLCRAEAPLKKEPTPPGGPPPVRITVPAYDVETSAAAKSWPITTGVALPQGALRSPENIRLLDERGVPVPVMGSIRGRWPGDGSIRWLGLDFTANLLLKRPRTFTLEYGPDVKPITVRGFKRGLLALRMEIVEDARVTDFEGAWWINTGNLLFTVNHERFSGITEAWVDVDGNGQYDWFEQILNARGGLAGPYLVDADGRTYRLSADRDVKISVEEGNALRTVLRVEGHLVPESGRGQDMGRCVTHITAFFGQPFLKIQCSIFLNEAAVRSPLRDIGIQEYLDGEFENRFQTGFGIPDSNISQIKDTGLVYMMKLRPGEYLLQSQGNTKLDQRGKNALNWAAASTGDRGLAVIMHNMDALYPKAIAMRPDRRFITHFWPPYGKPEVRSITTEIDRFTVGGLGFAMTGQTFDLTVPPNFAGGLKDQDGLRDFSAVRHMDLADPTGIALSYEALYVFLNGPLNARELSALDKTFQLRPHAVQDPAGLAASGVLKETLPSDRREKALAMAERLLALEDRYPAQGDVNDMGLRRRWLPDENRWTLDQYWMAGRADLPMALWTLYLQTGDPRLFRVAERNTRHAWCMDVCHGASASQITHADPRRRKIPGAFGNHRSPTHWFETCQVSDRSARIRGLLTAYYLTGDVMPLETALLWADAAKQYGQGVAGADGLAFLTNLDEILFQRHDPVILERRGDCAEHFFNMPPGDDLVDWAPGLREYYRQTGDPRVEVYLRNVADTPAAQEDRPGRVGLLRDLYAVTGDEQYLSQSEQALADIEARMDQPDFSWEDFCQYVFHGGQSEPAAP